MNKKRLSLIHNTVIPSTVATPPAESDTPTYGWKAAYAQDQIPVNPYDSWLCYQASSYLGRRVTLDEAKELFSKIDVHTRAPIQEEPKQPWWRRWFG